MCSIMTRSCGLSRSALLVFLFTSVAFPLRLAAQDTESDSSSPTAANAEAAKGWERVIYLPYQNLKDVFERHGATVFMPYLDYLKLWEKSFGQRRRAVQPPVGAVITKSTYSARVDKDIARITATYMVQVLDKPWAEVPVQFGNAAVGNITSADNQVVLLGRGAGSYALLFPEKGEQRVTLELEARIRTSPGGRSFEFQCPTVGVTTFELSIPQADQTVQLTPQLVTMPVEAGEHETRIKANLGSTPKIAALWHPRASLKPLMDLLTSVTNYSQVTIQDGLIHTDALLQYDVLRGEMTQLEIAVPLSHRILDVASSDAKIKGWRLLQVDNRQVVTVEFLSGLKQKVAVEVHTERPLPIDAIDVGGIGLQGEIHGIHAIGAVRESGQLVVSGAKDLALMVERQRGLVRINEAEVLKTIRSPGALNYKYYTPRFEFKLRVRLLKPRITVNHNTRLIFSEDELQLRADLQYTVERAGVFELSLKLPDNLSLDSVVGDVLKDHNVDDGVLKIELSDKRAGSLKFTVTAHRSFTAAAAETEHQLPLLEPLGVARETGHVQVYAPEAIDVVTDEDSLLAAQPNPFPNAAQLPGVGLASAWLYNRRPVVITVKTVRKPTRLTANVATSINVKQELVEVSTSLEYNVQYAGIDTFRFDVPEAVADQVQISVPAAATTTGIKQKSRSDEVTDGWVTWTVIMQRDVVGVQRLEVKYDLKPGSAQAAVAAEGDPQVSETAASAQVTIQAIRVLGVEGDNGTGTVKLSYLAGEVVVLKDRALSVSASNGSDDLESIDVRELNILSNNGTLAYRYFKQPVALQLSWKKLEIEKVVETVIERALVEIVLGRDEMATYRCRYLVKSSERQRLTMQLPAAHELLGLLVDGRRVNPERSDQDQTDEKREAFFVNVARVKQSEEAFSITVQFQIKLSQHLFETSAVWGSLDLPLPALAGNEGGGVVLQHLRAIVWVPDELALLGTPERFVLEYSAPSRGMFGQRVLRGRGAPNLDSWIDVSTGGIIDFPTEGNPYQFSSLGGAPRIAVTWCQMTTFTWVLSGAIVAIAWVLARTSWENRLTGLLLAAFGAAAYALRDADAVLQAFAAAQLGLTVMIAYWLIHGLGTLNFRSTVTLTPKTPAAGMIPQPDASDPDSSKNTT